MDDSEEQNPFLSPSPEELANVSVFPLIPALKKDITVRHISIIDLALKSIDIVTGVSVQFWKHTIDTVLGWEQLTASDINFAIVRPLVFKYARLKNTAVVYACLVVRSYFLVEADANLAYSGVMVSRAMLCEIMAMKLLTPFASHKIQIVAVLTTCWSPLAGATPDIVDEVREMLRGDTDELSEGQSALEMAIRTKAKAFLSSPVVQAIVNDMYSGRVIFSMAASGSRSVLADNYKPRAIETYDYRKAPFLDHYRLRVPRYNAIMEFFSFSLLLATYLFCLNDHDLQTMRFWEIVFIVMAAAFTLDEYTASKEHGWMIYIANLWNLFDTAFIAVFVVYLILRIRGLQSHNDALSDLAFDILACGACILFPRLAFFVVKNNVVVLALRAMISEFLFFICIAAICFSGLLFTLYTLGRDKWKVKDIAWLMVQIWFGNTYLSFGQASSFHPIFGPILMTGFAALSNTLLLTILISILSNTFAVIDSNARQEYLFQFSILTIEGVKSDALFSYQLPFNLLAFIILKPASFLLTPRALHSANVFLIKLTSFPILIAINIYEHHLASGQEFRESSKSFVHSVYSSLPRRIKNIRILEALVGSNPNDLYDAIFEVQAAHGSDLFNDSEEDIPVLHSPTSEAPTQAEPRREFPRYRSISRPRTPHRSPLRENPSLRDSPRLRKVSALAPLIPVEMPSTETKSPLARLFGVRQPPPSSSPQDIANLEGNLRRIEAVLEEVRDLPVRRLKDEMKELQDRQARIENLLLTLTRGMRNEPSHNSPRRQETM